MKQKRETIKDLAKLIAIGLAQNTNKAPCVRLDRGWSVDPELGLSPRTEGKLVDLHNRLKREVPDDFDYSITFENGEVFASCEFQNGMMAAAGGGFPVKTDRNFIKKLASFDWDTFRNELMRITESMDDEVSGPVPDWFKEHIASKRSNRC